MRDHLAKSAAKGHAWAQQRLHGHRLPAPFRTLYRHFRTMDGWRQSSGFGAMPLSLHDIAAYEARHSVRFLPGELSILKQLDALSLAKD